MRIATLLPSATEIVAALGCDGQLVGISHSCNYPEQLARLPRLTSTRVPFTQSSEAIDTFVRGHLVNQDALYDLHTERLADLAPDIVVSQALCDVCAVATGDVIRAIESLPSKPLLVDLNPNTLDDVFDDIRRVASALGANQSGDDLVASLRRRFDAVCDKTATIPSRDRPRVAFLEWLAPPFNGGHWNPQLVQAAGGIDLLGAHGKPSTTQSWEGIAERDPDVLFVACCGFRIERAMDDFSQLQNNDVWRNLTAVKTGNVYLTDGNAYFSSPGPRLIDGLEILAHALHPSVHADLHPGMLRQP